MQRLSIKGILLGGITDVAVTFLLGLPIVLIVGIQTIASGVPQDRASGVIEASLHAGPISGVLLLVGCLCSVLGGYVAAALARHDELLNGTLSAFLCVGIGLYSLSASHQAGQIWEVVLSEFGSPALGLLGGYLRLVQKRRVLPAVPSA